MMVSTWIFFFKAYNACLTFFFSSCLEHMEEAFYARFLVLSTLPYNCTSFPASKEQNSKYSWKFWHFFKNAWPRKGQHIRHWILAQSVSNFWLKTSAPPSKTISVNPITIPPAHPLHMPSTEKYPPGLKLKWNITLQNTFVWKKIEHIWKIYRGFNQTEIFWNQSRIKIYVIVT